jgi:hypothetical protein
MRKKFLFSLIMPWILNNAGIYSQCLFTGLSYSYCTGSAPATLSASVPNGTFSGAGVTGLTFNPYVAGAGVHTVSLNACDASYTVSQIPFAGETSTPNLTLLDNEVAGPLPIGFNFRFFCNSYTDFYLGSNGFITFSPSQPDGCCQGLPLPATAAPKNLIAFAWTDLNPQYGGTVRYHTAGTAPNRKLVVSFNCIFHSDSTAPIFTQIYLFETTNVIEIHHASKPTPTLTLNTTMGIQNINGNVAYVVPGKNGTPNWSSYLEGYRFTPGPFCNSSQTTTVFPDPTITVSSGKTEICSGQSVILTANGATNYLWSTSQTGSFINITPTTTTAYTVVGTDLNGCSNTASLQVQVSNCTEIGEDFKDAELMIIPNPSDGNIKITSVKKDMNLVILSQLGSIIKKISLTATNQQEVYLYDLPPGIYFIRSENVEALHTKIIVLE